MRCAVCHKKYSYFDMQPVPHESIGLTKNEFAIPEDPKPLVCYKCLGWEEKYKQLKKGE